MKALISSHHPLLGSLLDRELIENLFCQWQEMCRILRRSLLGRKRVANQLEFTDNLKRLGGGIQGDAKALDSGFEYSTGGWLWFESRVVSERLRLTL
jgi:hypothetical protein